MSVDEFGKVSQTESETYEQQRRLSSNNNSQTQITYELQDSFQVKDFFGALGIAIDRHKTSAMNVSFLTISLFLCLFLC